LDWMLGIPWGKRSKIKKDLLGAQALLDEDHFGLDKVKERIVEYLAVQQRANKLTGPILCLVGPPGVGKTYEMLTIGRARLKAGADVVIGVVETHGRAETEALLDGFEVIPRRPVPYHGTVLEEMDLDALLARRPALALVDELAHT
ncbi:hypothetical protein ACU8YC_28170, partial [Citrobacter sp. VF227]